MYSEYGELASIHMMEKIKSFLKKADMAMYNAKSNGKNEYRFFDIKYAK